MVRFTRGVLKVLRKADMDLSIVLTGDREIRRYNRKYLNHDRPTDVLAFGRGETSFPSRSNFLGDIMISVDQAKAYARRFGTAWRDAACSSGGRPLGPPAPRGWRGELELYIVHGILHLLGHDDHAFKDRKRMRKKESQVLKRVRSLRLEI